MDYSQYLRQKTEAANIYVSRAKTVDSSFLSLQKKQKAAHSGYNNIQTIPYFNGSVVLNNSLVNVNGVCPSKHQYTQGHTTTNNQSQQQDRAFRLAGAALCGDANYSTAPPGLQLKNCTEVSTILTQYNNLAPVPGQWKAYGYGQNHYTVRPDSNSDCYNCNTNKTTTPS